MRRMPSSAQRIQTRRAQPVIEGLEERRLLSSASHRHSVSTAAASSNGVFSHNGTEFTYTTPTGGQAVIQVVGLGNLAGTTVEQLRCAQPGLRRDQCLLEDRQPREGRQWPRAPGQHPNSQLIAAGAAEQRQRRGRQCDPGGLPQQFRSDRGRKHQPHVGREYRGARLGRSGYSDPPPRASAAAQHDYEHLELSDSRASCRRHRNSSARRSRPSTRAAVDHDELQQLDQHQHARGRPVDDHHE